MFNNLIKNKKPATPCEALQSQAIKGRHGVNIARRGMVNDAF
jgi:hypothetical protein